MNFIGSERYNICSASSSQQVSPRSTSQSEISFEGFSTSTFKCQLRLAASKACEKMVSPGLPEARRSATSASASSIFSVKVGSLIGPVSLEPSLWAYAFFAGPNSLDAYMVEESAGVEAGC